VEINITGRHMEITDAIRTYVTDRLSRFEEDFPRVENVHVILNVEKYRHMAEVVVQGGNHLRVESEETSDDMYVSIDGAVDKAEKQLRRARDKVQNHNKESLAVAEVEIQAKLEPDEA